MLICPPPPILESKLLFSVSQSNLIGIVAAGFYSGSHESLEYSRLPNLLLTQILESKLLFLGFVSLGSEIIAIGRKSVV